VALLTGVSTFVLLFLSRIRERYDQTGDNTAAVASGLQRTGGLLGRANWWAPWPLRRLYARYGIRDEIQAERAGAPV
jgi:hypothetical protein